MALPEIDWLQPRLLWSLPLIPVLLVPLTSARLVMPRPGKVALAVLRGGALALLCLSLAGPGLLFPESGSAGGDGQPGTVYLIDVSRSVPPEVQENVLDEVARRLGPEDEVILFAGKVLTLTTEDRNRLGRTSFRELTEDAGWAGDNSPRARTDIQEALGRAVESGKRKVLLFTDGNSTRGNPLRVLRTLRARGIEVETVALPVREPDGLRVLGLELPEEVLADTEYRGRLVLESRVPARVRLRIEKNGLEEHRETLALGAGVTVHRFPLRAGPPGLEVLRASVKLHSGGANGRRDDDVALAGVLVRKAPRVLLVSSAPAAFKRIASAAGLQCEVVAPEDFPEDLNDLRRQACVVFDDVPASGFSAASLSSLQSFVEDLGGGFLMIGGEASFAPGGWAETPAEAILPVWMAPRGFDSSLGLVLLLDSSGSMKGHPIAWARRAALDVIGLMRGRFLGVVRFSHFAEVVVDLQVVGMNSLIVRRDIGRIAAGGGTAFHPPLVEALQMLHGLPLQRKQVLLLSDGEAGDLGAVEELFPHLRAAEIHVSTVAIGHHANAETLRHIARNCGGEFYESRDFTRLPEIFSREVKRVAGPPYVEGDILPLVTGKDELLKRFESYPPPRLAGYISCTPKEKAEVLLASPSHDPLLVKGRAGLGRTAAFTSDFRQRWGRDWLAWPEAPSFWGELLQELARLDTSSYRTSLSRRGGHGVLVVDVVDDAGQYRNFLDLRARVTDPDGRQAPVILRQTGPGRYEGRFPISGPGVHDARVWLPGDPEEAWGRGVLTLSQWPEDLDARPNRPLLRELARGTGGRSHGSVADWSGADEATARTAGAQAKSMGKDRTDLSPWAASLALILLLLEITGRRLRWFTAGLPRGEGSRAQESERYQRIAENYLQLARQHATRGERAQAQDCYLKARAYFLKARQDEHARHMWEKYRNLEEHKLRSSGAFRRQGPPQE